VAPHHHLPATQSVVFPGSLTMRRERMSGKKSMKWKRRKTRNEIYNLFLMNFVNFVMIQINIFPNFLLLVSLL